MLTLRKMCYNTTIMDDRDIWYSAGIIDGEGYIGIIKSKRSYVKKYNSFHATVPYQYTPAVKVASVTREMVEQLQQFFGGYLSHRVHKNNQKDSYSWEVKNWNRVEEFLRIIGPCLKVKHEQAQVVFKFIEFRRNRRLNKKKDLYRYTEEELAEMERYYLRIRELNFRGKSPATTE